MDWLSKVEEERRQKSAAEEEANEKRRRAAEEVRASLSAVETRLRPTLDPLVNDVERRLGVHLAVRLTSTEFTVSAPNPPKSDLVHEHRIIFSQPQGGRGVRVAAIRADQIDRSTEYMPADMRLAEWRGEDEVVVEGEVDVEDLIKGDLQQLIEWLVRTALSERERVPAPSLRRAVKDAKGGQLGCLIMFLILLAFGLFCYWVVHQAAGRPITYGHTAIPERLASIAPTWHPAMLRPQTGAYYRPYRSLEGAEAIHVVLRRQAQ